MKIMAILGSSRKNGNTAQLTEHVLNGIPHTKVDLSDYDLQPITDKRHIKGGFTHVEDDYEELFHLFLEHDTIIFATPLYWFGMSAQMKVFFDRWSQYMRQNIDYFNQKMSKKKAYVIVIGHNPSPKPAALPLIQQFQLIFSYTGMEFVDYLIGHGNKPGEINNDADALVAASNWRKQLTTYAHK